MHRSGLAGVIAAIFVLGLSATGTMQREDLKLPAKLANYKGWQTFLKSPKPVPLEFWLRCMAPTPDDWAAARKKYGPHTERYVQVYGNQTAANALSHKQQFPVGAIIAKEKLLGGESGHIEGIAFMVKSSNAKFKSTAGWEFLYFPDSPKARKTHEACASCHQGAAKTDYVFGQYPN